MKRTYLLKILVAILLVVGLLAPSTATASSSTTVKLWIGNASMSVNGVQQLIDVQGTKPVIVAGRTLVPIRAVIEAFGGSAAWEASTRKATVTLGKDSLDLWIDKPQASLNGTALAIDSANTAVVPVITNGRTMLPLRFVAESLGIDIEYDATSKMITLTYASVVTPPVVTPPAVTPPVVTPPAIAGYSYSNPAPLNTVQTITVEEYSSRVYTVEMSVNQIIRGADAWNLLRARSVFATPAPEGYEYLLAKIYFKLVDISEGQTYTVNWVPIPLISSTGVQYDYITQLPPEPSISFVTIYKGASVEGWAPYMVKKDDPTPKLAFGRNYDGTGGIWFKAY